MKIKDLFKPVDMTVGNPVKQILIFTIPMLLGNIAQQLYNTVDSIIVGRFVGDNALAAVGSAGPIVNLMLVFFIGISVGANIMVSQYFGARQRDELSRSIGCCIALIIVSSLFVTILGLIIARPLLELLNTPEAIIDWCGSYLRIFFIGIAGTAFFNILSGVLRGLGDSVSALIYLLIATVLNIILDYTFVAYFSMGVAGVALATIIAQGVSAVLCVLKLRSMSHLFDLRLSHLLPKKEYWVRLVKLGMPSGVTQAIMSLSMIVVQSLTNSFGEMFIAANVIVMRIDGFVVLPSISFGTAMTTFAGQNIGANRMDRVLKGAKDGTLAAMGISAAFTGLVLIFGRPIMGIFTTTQELIALSYRLMLIIATGYIGMAISQCLFGIMRGAGDTVVPMWMTILTTIAVRVPLAYILVYLTKTPERPKGNFYMMHTSLLATWLVGALLAFIVYRRGKWKDKGIVRREEDLTALD